MFDIFWIKLIPRIYLHYFTRLTQVCTNMNKKKTQYQ